jgi:hypothetical protein
MRAMGNQWLILLYLMQSCIGHFTVDGCYINYTWLIPL